MEQLSLLKSFVYGIQEKRGEKFSTLLRYFAPELVTNALIYSLPILVDAKFIGLLSSTPTYAALAASNTFLNLILKLAEAVSVGTVILVGVHNGAKEYEKAGDALRDSFWITIVCGLSLGGLLWLAAPAIYSWYGLAPDVIQLSVPFMRLRAVGVALMFIFFACVGFLRGIKDTRTPMRLYVLGTFIFLCVDYPLIFGTPWTPAFGLNGSAMATISQYSIMLCAAILYIIFSPAVARYKINLLRSVTSVGEVIRLIRMTIPVVIDKATIATSYIWLCKIMATVGTCGVAAFYTIKEMERLALVPAVASAQVITFLVSNSIGAGQWDVVRANIKKVLFITLVVVSFLIALTLLFPKAIISFFDRKGDFTYLAAQALPILSILSFFDVLQLVLAGALRGAGDVNMVMITRIIVCGGFFAPISWLSAYIPVDNEFLRFMLIYSSFYCGSALMSMAYIYRFRSGQWTRTLRSEGLV
jgi:putative MATE family efflux protein